MFPENVVDGGGGGAKHKQSFKYFSTKISKEIANDFITLTIY